MKRTIIVALSLILVLLAFTSCEEEVHVHTWDKGTVTKAATCTEKGVKTYICTGCKETKTEDIAIDPNNHTWDEGEVTKAASCTENGEVVYKCACGEKKTEVIKATGHKLEKTVVDPTYLKKGSVTVKCSECDEYPVNTDTLDRKDATGWGGDFTHTVISPDTCIYMSFIILPNNKIKTFSNFRGFNSKSGTVDLYEEISDYDIEEKVDGEGNVSYFISIGEMDLPVTENEGELTVVFSMPINENDIITQEITLAPDFHVHTGTGEEKKYCESNTPEQRNGGLCKYLDCDTAQCLSFGDNKVNVKIVTKTHYFPQALPGDTCEYCGVQYNLSKESM